MINTICINPGQGTQQNHFSAEIVLRELMNEAKCIRLVCSLIFHKYYDFTPLLLKFIFTFCVKDRLCDREAVNADVSFCGPCLVHVEEPLGAFRGLFAGTYL